MQGFCEGKTLYECRNERSLLKKKSETRIHTHKGAKESKHIKGSKERYLLEITLKIHMLCFVLVNSVLLSLKKTEMSLQK